MGEEEEDKEEDKDKEDVYFERRTTGSHTRSQSRSLSFLVQRFARFSSSSTLLFPPRKEKRAFKNRLAPFDIMTTTTLTTSPKKRGSPPREERKRRRREDKEDKEEPSDFDLFCLVYNFLQSNAYEDAAQKMMREMKRRLKAPDPEHNTETQQKTTKKKMNKTRTKKLVQMLNALTTTTTTSNGEKDDERGRGGGLLLPKVKPLRNVVREFLSLKTKERRRTKSANEPMKMIFRQCEEAFGNVGRDGLSKEKEVEEEEEDDDEDDDGRRGVVGIAEEEEEEEEDAAAAQPHLIQTRDDTTTTTNTNRERRNKKKQAAPQRKHKQTLYKQSLDDANVREKIADVIVRTLHKKTGRTPNPTPTLYNSAKSNKNIEREELAFSDVEEDEDDDGNEFGGVTELELDKIAEMMDKPEDTMETANAILGSLMESTDNDLGRFLEDLVAQTEHGNTKEINKLPTPKKRLLLKEDQKAVNLKETNNGQKTP